MKKKEPGLVPAKLYHQFRQTMPVACVDLLVLNPDAEVLLLKRENPPARGEWWFPGGRIHYLENRKTAVVRKLHEECGLTGKIVADAGTYDVILDLNTPHASHAVTTVYIVQVRRKKIRLDLQSSRYAWKTVPEWMKSLKAGFVKMILKNVLDAVR